MTVVLAAVNQGHNSSGGGLFFVAWILLAIWAWRRDRNK